MKEQMNIHTLLVKIITLVWLHRSQVKIRIYFSCRENLQITKYNYTYPLYFIKHIKIGFDHEF